MSEAACWHDGSLLGGHIRYRQPLIGYRTGIEPVLLAACIAAKPGEQVLEAGTGAGAGLLALATRVAGISGTGVELNPQMAELARFNFAANFQARLQPVCTDITQWRSATLFDHAFANPPWHHEAGTPSPLPGRSQAKMAHAGLLAAWATALARAVRRRGSVSFILPAAQLSAGISALCAAKCPEITVIPLWPHDAEPAKLVILRAVRLGKGRCHMLPGLVLHKANGDYTGPAEQVLRHGAGLFLP